MEHWVERLDMSAVIYIKTYYSLAVQVPWLDPGEVHVMRLLGKFVEMREDKLWFG